jgi:hypothetical protein
VTDPEVVTLPSENSMLWENHSAPSGPETIVPGTSISVRLVANV